MGIRAAACNLLVVGGVVEREGGSFCSRCAYGLRVEGKVCGSGGDVGGAGDENTTYVFSFCSTSAKHDTSYRWIIRNVYCGRSP